MCCVKLVYSDAILVNFPNSVKLEFLSGWCQVPFGIYLYDCLGVEAIVFENLSVVKLPVIVTLSFTIKRVIIQARLQFGYKMVIGTPYAISKLNNGIR